MVESVIATLLAPWLLLAAPGGVQASAPDGVSMGGEDEIARLEAQSATVVRQTAAGDAGDGRPGAAVHHYVIEDVAGEGRPWIGRVRVRGANLALETGDGSLLPLAGPLARKRIAGPGYKVWVIGDLRGQPAALHVRRLGVLAPPH